jgi:hypothetical protein
MAVETFEDNFIELNVEPEWTDKVHGFALGSWVQGGISGVDNIPLVELTKRTGYLKKEVDTIIGLSLGNKPFIISSDKRVLQIKSGTIIKLGSRIFHAEEDTALDIAALLDTGVLANGKDYYIFLCPGTELGSVIVKVSLTKTNPQGFIPDDVLLIGGFHTLCANAGSGMTYVEGGVTKQHPLNDYVAGDILPFSVWCLNHRPFSEPEGMVYIAKLDFWCDIYLQSGSGANTKSAYQGAATVSRQYVDFVEDLFCVKKTLLNDEEFSCAMIGSNEQTNVAGSSNASLNANGTGGKSDTVGRRMISAYGVEEGCGLLWQWLRMYGNTSNTEWDWNTQSGNKGQYYGPMAVVLAGGHWGDGANCGSRCRNAGTERSYSDTRFGGRGRSRTRR